MHLSVQKLWNNDTEWHWSHLLSSTFRHYVCSSPVECPLSTSMAQPFKKHSSCHSLQRDLWKIILSFHGPREPQSRAAFGAPLARPCTEQHLPPQQPQHWADQSQLLISALPRGFLVPGTSFPALCQLRKPQRWPALNDILCLLYIHLHTNSEGAQIKDDA